MRNISSSHPFTHLVGAGEIAECVCKGGLDVDGRTAQQGTGGATTAEAGREEEGEADGEGERSRVGMGQGDRYQTQARQKKNARLVLPRGITLRYATVPKSLPRKRRFNHFTPRTDHLQIIPTPRFAMVVEADRSSVMTCTICTI